MYIHKPTCSTNIVQDITKAFNLIIKQKKLYHIALTETEAKHIKDLRFLLTNKLLNRIKNDYKYSYEHLNFLFVIEIGGLISKEDYFNHSINNLGEHAHILISSSISSQTIEYYLQSTFHSRIDIYIEDITKRNDKENFLGYLLKQKSILTTDNYNYKITY